MSKPENDSLYRLIHSLNKSEKRMFKIYANRLSSNYADDKKFIILFNAIAGQKKYDEEKIRKKNPELSKSQFSNLKQHLYRQILKCLRTATHTSPADMQITEMVDQAKILYHKCLYPDALKIIDKAKKAALKKDLSFLFLELLELEKLALQQGMKENIETRINEITFESNETIRTLQLINHFSNLSLKLNSIYQKAGFIRNRIDLDTITGFFTNSLPPYDEKKLSFQQKMYLYYAYTGYYFFIQDFEKGLIYSLRWEKLFEENPEMIPLKTEMYIKALNSVLVAQNKLYLYHDFMNTHRKLVGIKRNKNILLTENINLTLFRTIYIHEINRHFMLGEFKSGTRIVSKFENELNNFIPKLDKNTVMLFYYKIACLYLGSGNFKTSVKWLNKTIQESESGIREDLNSFARILKLICYFELNDEEMIESNIRSTYRYLLKKENFIRYQQYITSFLRGLRKDITREQIIDRFNILKNQMKELEKVPFQRRAFIYFDIISYLESRIEGKSIEEVVQKKAKIRILR
jgi:CII-binding regulator of phage lambda lysogenization HflD